MTEDQIEIISELLRLLENNGLHLRYDREIMARAKDEFGPMIAAHYRAKRQRAG